MDSDPAEPQEESARRKLTPLEALEVYSANHAETVDELLEWPYRRFVKAYEFFQKRDAVEKIDQRMNQHIAALYSNTNLDDEKNDRQKVIQNVEQYYKLIKDIIMGDSSESAREEKEIQKLEENDPFLAAGKRNRIKINPAEIKFKANG